MTGPASDKCTGCGRPLSRYNTGKRCQACVSAGRKSSSTRPGENRRSLIDRAKLAQLRHDQGWTQAMLGDYAGLSRDMVKKLEKGTRKSASLATMQALARALNVPVGVLLGDSAVTEPATEISRPADMAGQRQQENKPYRPTLMRALITERHWQRFKTFEAQFRRAAKELAEREDDRDLAKLTISSRQWERWYSGTVKTEPHPDACRVLEHMFGHPVQQLLAPAGSGAGQDQQASQQNLTEPEGGHKVLPWDVFPTLPAPSLAPDPDMYERITRAVENGEYVDSAVIAWLERCLVEHRRIEDEAGAGPLVDIVRVQLSVITKLARQARTPVTDRLVDLAAQYAQFMAWLCNDSGNKAAALAWYDRAHDWAIEADDASMAATTLSMKAHLAWSVGDAIRCVRFGESARWHEGKTSFGVQGMAAQMTARGYALCGEPDRAHRALDDAESLIAAAASRPEDEPPWMYFYGDTWFTAQRGMIETELAERRKGSARNAVTLLEKALHDLADSYRRDRTWYGTVLARAHAAADDCDAAADIGLKFAADAMAVNRYAADELEQLAVSLDQRGVREAHDLSDALTATAR